MTITRAGIMAIALLATSAASTPTGFGQTAGTPAPAAAGAPVAPAGARGEDKKEGNERNFYEVLQDLVADFEFDIRNGEVTGLKDLAIRNVAVSENIPPSFKSHLEHITTEAILKNSKTRVLQCLQCKARRTVVNGDKVVVTSPESNPIELARIAKAQAILNFMDIAFTYQPSGMVLSFYISDPESASVIWSRSYNSETSRAAAFRRGVDYSQLDNARKYTEYQASLQHHLTLYFFGSPNIANNPSPILALGYRLMERYDNRKKEVGFEANYFADVGTIVNSAGATATNLYNFPSLNLTLLFSHAWNFFGEEENYNRIRGSLLTQIGGTYATGFLGALLRVGWEFRLGKHFSATPVLGYRPPSGAFLSGTQSGTLTGLEYGLGISVVF